MTWTIGPPIGSLAHLLQMIGIRYCNHVHQNTGLVPLIFFTPDPAGATQRRRGECSMRLVGLEKPALDDSWNTDRKLRSGVRATYCNGTLQAAFVLLPCRPASVRDRRRD